MEQNKDTEKVLEAIILVHMKNNISCSFEHFKDIAEKEFDTSLDKHGLFTYYMKLPVKILDDISNNIEEINNFSKDWAKSIKREKVFKTLTTLQITGGHPRLRLPFVDQEDSLSKAMVSVAPLENFMITDIFGNKREILSDDEHNLVIRVNENEIIYDREMNVIQPNQQEFKMG